MQPGGDSPKQLEKQDDGGPKGIDDLEDDGSPAFESGPNSLQILRLFFPSARSLSQRRGSLSVDLPGLRAAGLWLGLRGSIE